MIYWPYGKSDEFPELGEGGRTACAGPVFHYQSKFAKTGGFPEQYDNCLLFYDWQRPFMKWARLDKNAKLHGIEPFTSAVAVVYEKNKVLEAQTAGAPVIRRPVDSQFGPDGCLYLLDYGETWGVNPDAKLLKISYQRGNLAPLAVARATPDSGREPLTVSLSSVGSKDYEGDSLRYEWRLHPGNKLISTEANPKFTVAQPGNYVVELAGRRCTRWKIEKHYPIARGKRSADGSLPFAAGRRFLHTGRGVELQTSGGRCRGRQLSSL